MENTATTRSVWSKALTMLLTMVLCATGLTLMSPKAHAAGYKPKDTVKISVLSDGTHRGPGTNTFVNSENGYTPGDNTPNDGVVASGDTVVYGVDLDIKAGPARSVDILFSKAGKGDALEMADFSKLTFNSAIAKATPISGGVRVEIVRGAVATLQTTVAVRAKDTGGTAVEDNKVKAELRNGDYSFTSLTRGVTVVSAPMGDLTIKGSENTAISGEKASGTGYFEIIPKKLQPQGYSKHGISASGKWKTDIDVSDFPAGTKFTLDGKALTVSGGIIKNVTGKGNAKLGFALPAGSLPTEEAAQSHIIKLNVHEDSFSAGELKNIPDPGNGESAQYNTENHKHNGKLVGADRGDMLPNNNYGKAFWYFVKEPTGFWRHDTGVPQNSDQTIFEDGNVYWKGSNPLNWGAYYARWNGYKTASRTHIVNDNDLSHRVTMLTDRVKRQNSTIKPSDFMVEHAINSQKGTNFVPQSYDTTRDVVVTANGKKVSSNHYTVEFKVNGRWVKSEEAVTSATESRVRFKDEAFTMGDKVEVFWLGKAHDDYSRDKDNGKLLNTSALVTFNGAENEENWWNVNTPLKFPTTPGYHIGIESLDKENVTLGKDQRGLTTWRVTNTVSDPAVSTGHSQSITLTLDSVLDASTFELKSANGWTVAKRSGQTVTLKRSGNLSIEKADKKESFDVRGYHPDFTFTAKTVIAPYGEKNGQITPVQTAVTAKGTLTYPKVASLPSGKRTSNSSDNVTIESVREVSSFIEALDDTVEVTDHMSWKVAVNVGRVKDADAWEQEVRMPKNGDISYMDDVKKSNNQNISIDPETGKDRNGIYDGIGRTKHEGTYDLTKMKVTAPPGSSIVFYNKNSQGKPVSEVRVPVAADGTVAVKPGYDFFRLEAKGNLSDSQTGSAEITFEITPKNNRPKDVYVAWASAPKVNGKERSSMPWPDDIRVVASEISGIVYHDENNNARFTEGEKPYSGVTVQLQKKNASGTWTNVPGAKQVTKADGKYHFTNLHSGKYRVILPNVKRASKGQDITAGEGSLPSKQKNRFNVEKPTQQTQSGRAVYENSASEIVIQLGKEDHSKNNDFGYIQNGADVQLDKSEARVKQNSDGTASVEWDVHVKNTGNVPIKDMELFDRTSTEVKGLDASVSYREVGREITGTPIAVTGVSPGDGSAVATTDGYWIVKSGGSTVKAKGVTGIPIAVTGNYPNYSGGSAVATTDGYWIVKSDGSTVKAQGVTGTPIAVTGGSPGDGSAVATTDGYWIVKSDGSTVKAKGVTGTPIAATGYFPNIDGSAVATTDGYWIVKSDGSTVKAQGVTGTPIAVTGDSPGKGFAVATTDGYWIVKSDGSAVKVQGVIGIPIAVTGDSPGKGFAVATTHGYWVVKSDGSAVKAQGVIGIPIAVTGGLPNHRGSVVATTDGYWIVESDGSTVKAGEKSRYVDIQSLVGKSSKIVAGSDKRTWTERAYDLPELLPGEETVVILKGTVTRDKADLIVGNQAWVTSDLTPRAGIKDYSNIPVTGTGQPAGVPDVPKIPKASEFDPSGIYGTPTVGINQGLGNDERPVDDLADQTPAKIPGNPSANLNGSVDGYAWYDTNKNGNRDSTEKTVVGMKVLVYNPDTGAVYGEIETDSKGYWRLDKLPVGAKVAVQYSSSGWTHNGKTWTPVKTGAKNTKRDSDVDDYGLVVRDITLTEEHNTGNADIGLRAMEDGAITLTKGGVKDTAQNAEKYEITGDQRLTNNKDAATITDLSGANAATGEIDDKDGDPRTVAYQYSFTNSGGEDLMNLTLKDVTDKGNDAVIAKPFEHYNNAGKRLGVGTVKGGVFTLSSGKALVLKPGEKVVGAVSFAFTKKAPEHKNTLNITGDVTIDGGKTPTGKTVKDSDPLEASYSFVETPVDLRVKKTDADTDKPLGGVAFELQKTTYSSLDEIAEDNLSALTGSPKKVTTNAQGQITFGKVESGIYRLKETKAADGYFAPKGAWYVELRYDEAGLPFTKLKAVGGAEQATVTNSKSGADWGEIALENTRAERLAITKVGMDGTPLEGAEFELVGPHGAKHTVTTTGARTESGDLEPGRYTITEVKAPEGHALLAEPVTVEITQSGITIISGKGLVEAGASHGNVHEIIISNVASAKLPMTGQSGYAWNILFGLMLAAAAGGYWYKRREAVEVKV